MRAIEVGGLRYGVVRRPNPGRLPLLLLHGFTGRASGWDEHLRAFARHFDVVAVDLPGHGRSGIPDDPCRVTVERTADDLAAILERLGSRPAHVLGYSLGARMALRLAITHPTDVGRLVLESPSAGIADADQRAARRASDEALARRIESDGIEAFVEGWERLPIFASQASTMTPAARASLRRGRLANRAVGLAASLRGAGQGAMEPLFDRLSAIRKPVLVIAGALDPVGLTRARSVADAIPSARFAVVPDAGHAPHLERPAAYRRLVLDFLLETAS